MSVAEIQRVASAAQTTNATAWVVTVAATTTVGHRVILAVESTGGRAVASITDSRGNTWTVDQVSTNTTNVRCSVASSPLATALLSGDTITVTMTGSCQGRVGGWEYSGIAAAAASVETSGTIGTSTGLSITAPAPGLVFSAIAVGLTETFTIPAGFTERNASQQSGGNSVDTAERIVSTGGTVAAGWSWATSAAFAEVIVTYPLPTDSPTGTATASGSLTATTVYLPALAGGSVQSGQPTEHHTVPNELDGSQTATGTLHPVEWGPGTLWGGFTWSEGAGDAAVSTDGPAGSQTSTGAPGAALIGHATPAGTETAAGSTTNLLTHATTPAGTELATGPIAEHYAVAPNGGTFQDPANGAGVQSGSLTESFTTHATPAGTETADGTIVEGLRRAAAEAGSETAAGSLTAAVTHTAAPAGAATATGSAGAATIFTDQMAGVQTADGHIPPAYVDAPAGIQTADGTVVEDNRAHVLDVRLSDSLITLVNLTREPMTNRYTHGDEIRLTADFVDALTGALIDPATVTVQVHKPNGTIVPLTPVRDALGVFHVDVVLDQAGHWRWRAFGLGSGQAVGQDDFNVEPLDF